MYHSFIKNIRTDADGQEQFTTRHIVASRGPSAMLALDGHRHSGLLLCMSWRFVVCILVSPQALQKRLSRSRCRLGADLRGPKEPRVRRRVKLAPPGKYDTSICAAAAIRAVVTITAATCASVVIIVG